MLPLHLAEACLGQVHSVGKKGLVLVSCALPDLLSFARQSNPFDTQLEMHMCQLSAGIEVRHHLCSGLEV